jgi:hypothetical protein
LSSCSERIQHAAIPCGFLRLSDALGGRGTDAKRCRMVGDFLQYDCRVFQRMRRPVGLEKQPREVGS